MADKNIKINIQTVLDDKGTKGGIDELLKLRLAAKETSAASVSNAEKMKAAGEVHAAAMAEARAASDELFVGLEKISEGLEDIAESGDEANAEGTELDENINNIARSQKAQSLAMLASEVGKIGAKFKEAADEVEEFDKEAAASLRKTGERVEEVTGAVSALALGFAVGGPVGAAVAGLALSVGVLVEVFKDTEVAAIRAAAVQREAMRRVEESVRQATAAEAERKAVFETGNVLGALSAELEGMRTITTELETQLALVKERRRLENEALQADDQAALAKVDEEEAGGKITAAQAAEKRAKIEAEARKRARETRKQEAIEDANLAISDAKVKMEAQEQAQGAFDKLEAMRQDADKKATGLAEYADKEIPKMVPNPETGELSETDKKFSADIAREIETARKVLEITSAAAAGAKSTLDTAKRETATAQSNVDSKTTRAKDVVATVDRIGEADTRTQESRARVRDIGEERKAEREKLRDRLPGLEEKLETTASANEARIKNSPRGKASPDLSNLATEIKNADNQAEINAVREAIKAKSGELGAAVVSALNEVVSQQERVVKEIYNVKARVRKLELE